MTSAPSMPADHPLRRLLADEVHARPPAAVAPPAVVSCLALTDVPLGHVLRRVADLAVAHGRPRPPDDAGHVIVELPDVRVKWERHGEFTSLTFVRSMLGSGWERFGGGAATEPDFPTALQALPAGWLRELPGQVMAAADILLLPAPWGREGAPQASDLAWIGRWFAADALAGARVLDGAACVFTDFRLGPQGRTRWLVLSAAMGPAQSARVAQRIIEIEIYRLMALLAYPLARAAFPQLDVVEKALADITAATAALHDQAPGARVQAQERKLLDELTRLAAEVERSVAATAFRFSAAQAYWDLVRARIAEFREQRIGDMRTLGGFLSRRLAPAMNSCAAAARRQEALSARVERASALLRTRVDVAREEQNQQLLAAMERRGKIALRLQQTVEGLSIAALTYYGAGLVGYLAKPLRTVWPKLNPDWVVAAAVPVIAVLLYLAVRRLRRRLRAD
jgi:uncharacterized membrane-anchored protein